MTSKTSKIFGMDLDDVLKVYLRGDGDPFDCVSGSFWLDPDFDSSVFRFRSSGGKVIAGPISAIAAVVCRRT